MKIIDEKIINIKPYKNNPRINDEGVSRVAKSLEEFGWQQPIVVDKNKVIIVGHTRWMAARSLGYKTVPICIANLTKKKADAYRIMDNRSGEFSGWDDNKLFQELKGLDGTYGGGFFEIDINEGLESGDTEFEAWDFSETADESIITIRSSLDLQAEIRKRLKGLDCDIEASFIKVT